MYRHPASLRAATYLIIIALSVLLVAGLATAGYFIVYREFERLEAKHAQADLNRAKASITGELERLSATARDWAFWDDTYQFVARDQKAYITANLMDNTFGNLRVDFMLFLDPSLSFHYGKFFDREHATSAPFPEGIIAAIQSSRAQLSGLTAAGWQGLIRFRGGLAVAAAMPILTSEMKGPQQGVLVIGNVVNAAFNEQLTNQVGLPTTLRTPTGDSIAAATSFGESNLDHLGPIAFTVTGTKSATISQIIMAPSGQAVGDLGVSLKRDIHIQAIRVSTYTFVALVVICASFAVLAGILVHRFVLSPLSTLGSSVRSIRERGDPSIRVPSIGTAELSDLASDINNMLVSLEDSQKQLAELQFQQDTDILLSGIPALVYHKDTALRLVDANRQFCSFFGISPADLASDFSGRIESEAVAAINRAEHAALESRTPQGPSELRIHVGGRSAWVEHVVVPIFAQSEVRGVVGLMFDITRNKVLEESLRQSYKLEAIGRLAGGIAHDFNNMLQVLFGHLHTARDLSKGNEPATEIVAKMNDVAVRAADVVRRILAFSRQQTLHKSPTDVNSLICDVDSLLSESIPPTISRAFKLDAVQSVALIDKNAIEHVIINLCINARDEMPEGGVLTLATRNERIEGESRSNHPWATPGDYIVIDVSDTGSGIEEQHKERVFDPFFTTKEVGKGTGLGLAVAHGTVVQHGGAIRAGSSPGGGALFSVFLPLAARQDEPGLARASEASRFKKGEGAILLAEDSPEVQSVVRKMLHDAGYQVVTASQGEEAVRMFRSNRQRILAVVMDIVMPHEDGLSAMRRLREQNPNLPILLITGHFEAGDDAWARDNAETIVLRKPFTPEELIDALHKATEANGATSARPA